MDSQIEQIKSKLNILDVVGSYVKLTKTGINYRGICPFHSEKTPSFFVSPARQTWHCFGCGAGFSIFDFVMKIEGIEFGDALKILANKAGVVLKRENPQLRTERERLYEICELACKFFEKQLEGNVGKEAKDYLLKRGITEDSVKKWRLGYSPDSWSGLTDFLIGKGYQRGEIIRAGLAIQKPARNASPARQPISLGGGHSDAGGENAYIDSYDRFRGRIIFPVFDLNSNVVGFGGRVFKQQGETAKYINTPQTLLYDKSNVLYGLNNAKLATRKQNQCVVTEGYTDVIMCHQAGFENTVAASGTALTFQHLNILKRYSENLILAFDMDIAGDSATKRGISMAHEQGFNIKIIESYEKNLDPADIVAKDPRMWQESLAKAKSIMDYYFDWAFSNLDKNSPLGKKEIGKIILPAVKRLQNKIEQSHWIQKLSTMLSVKEEAILEEMAKIKGDVSPQTQPAQENATGNGEKTTLNKEGRKKIIEEKIIALILKNPDYIKIIEEEDHGLFSEKISQLLKRLKEIIDLPEDQLLKKEGEKDFRMLFESVAVSDNEFKNFIVALALKGDIVYEKDDQEEMKLCLLQLKNIELKNKLNKISDEIKKEETAGEHQKASNLVEEFNKLTKEL